jgi:cyclopropane fatty-acyl-phospholipid synthase-like methyltransferase
MAATKKEQKNKNYHKSRFQFDPARQKVWRAIIEYLQPHIGDNKVVLDLGTGWGDFINGVTAKKKWAVDMGPDVKDNMNSDVIFINKSADQLDDIPNNSVDVMFSSNLMEHLDAEQFASTMKALKKKIKKNGTIILIGPNFKYAYRHYFDDYTHKTIYSHISLADAMREHGFTPVKVVPKFLPLSLKSRLPKSYWLTKLYLALPFSPMGKQMLLVFKV